MFISAVLRLADIFTMNHRGRQRIRSRLSPAHFNAYRSSVLKRQADRVTIEDVKRKSHYDAELTTLILCDLRVIIQLEDN